MNSATVSPCDNNHHLRCEQCKQVIQKAEGVVPCLNCQKVFYCSTSHRKAHLSKHEKSGCFPAIIQSHPDCGRYWVASRDIGMDEVICVEKAIVFAPNVPFVSPLYPTCLGCCRGTNPSYRCSKCSWPMCNKKCEKFACHAMNECKVFRKNKIQPNCRPQYYFFIQFLRTLLLKTHDPKSFAEVMQLEAHIEARKKVKEEVLMLNSFYTFLTEECNMDYDLHVIDQIVGVNRVNSYSADAVINGKKRFCTAVFPKMSLINHSCKPNTRTILHEKGGLVISMELRASVDIRQGEEICQQYLSSTKGTLFRQETLYEDWFFKCQCKRCQDPTEFNTYFSAIKCTKCPEGYLLPINPLQAESVWKCGVIINTDYFVDKGCGYSLPKEKVKELLENYNKQIKLAERDPEGIEKLITELSAHFLHPNHYLLVNAKFGILDDIVRKVNYTLGGCSKNVVEDEDILKAVEYTKSVLTVTRAICAGRSYCVGVILYFLASCLIELRKRKVYSKLADDSQIESIVKEAWSMLHIESDGSTYKEMARCLEEKSVVINVENLSFS